MLTLLQIIELSKVAPVLFYRPANLLFFYKPPFTLALVNRTISSYSCSLMSLLLLQNALYSVCFAGEP